jgi:hypothetical protein
MLDKRSVKDILKQLVEGSIRESGGNFNFKCFRCGDSKKTNSKKRGWVLFDGEKITLYCFNCYEPVSFVKYLKDNHTHIYNQYVKNRDVHAILNLSKKDIKVIEQKHKGIEIITDVFNENSFGLYDKNLDKKKMLLQYEALKFVINRKIPKEYSKKMRVSYNGKFKDRILIPYLTYDEEVYCFQGRSLTGKEPKYLTNKPDDNTKIFNYYTANPNETVYIMEGPIDSMFFNNGIATSGIVNYDTAQYKEICDKFNQRVWVFDNDKTGNDMASIYASNGENIFCWGNERVKDVNDLVLKNNLTEKELLDIINKGTSTKFEALVNLKIGRKYEKR